ncbi:F-box/LRR-repeat protein At3g26922-like isoform X1 [Oryza glaberrima]|uniref:F-box/LRR-repeat protein At3g26922-like isoform X1 n=1 Tax=Oryza glaberrima TaxID=4538 RepID=UPI00224C12D9|nr:F-box/LRR-repeat protein At3g26922-like isoform X1 [Oryza glaberrima]
MVADSPRPPDALFSLPLDVLDNILSRLHIYEVVRTSALSRAWCRRWAALPSVDLARSPGISEPDVDAILLRRSAALRTFRLVARARKGTWSVDALHHWLLYLSRSGVQALDLSFPELRFRLHPCLFSCGELTSLALNSCRLPPAPSGFAGFPNLKTLRLEDVDVPRHGGKEVAALIAASPLLEDLGLLAVKLIGDGPDEEWVIRAPNLRNLTMVCETAFGGRVEDLPRLDEGRLFGPKCAKFLAGMSQGCTEGAKEFEANDKFLNAQLTDDMFVKLHVVQLKNIACVRNEMHFMEFVLSKARLLRKLYVRLSFYAICSNEEAVIDIAEYPRTSSDAEIIFMGRESESLLNEMQRHHGYIH